VTDAPAPSPAPDPDYFRHERPTRIVPFPFSEPALAGYCASRTRRMAGALLAAGMDPFAEHLEDFAAWLEREYELPPPGMSA